MSLFFRRKNRKTGFTLLELIIVIAIISILYGIVVIALNPAQRIASAYDSQRLSDINALTRSLQQYFIDNYGYQGLNLPPEETEICDTGYFTGTEEKGTCKNTVDLSILVPEYLAGIPTDPLNLISKPENSPEILSGNGYTVKVDENLNIEIKSINLTSNNSPESTLNNLKIVDTSYQIILLLALALIILVLTIYFVIRTYRTRD